MNIVDQQTFRDAMSCMGAAVNIITTDGPAGRAGQWGTIGAGTLMVCLPLMLAFILFQKQFLRSFGFSGIK